MRTQASTSVGDSTEFAECPSSFVRLTKDYGGQDVVTGSTDRTSDRATRTGDANKDVHNRRIRLVPSNNLGHKGQAL